jgi:hypothetical protein
MTGWRASKKRQAAGLAVFLLRGLNVAGAVIISDG